MKKKFFLFSALLLISTLTFANYYSNSTMSGDTDCSSCTPVKLIVVTIWTGSCETTTTSTNPLTGETTITTTKTPCGKNNGSWDWFWE